MTPFSSSPATAAAAGLGLAIYHLLCSDIERCADWTERAIAERHPAIFLFLVHAAGLRRSHRWPALAKMLNLPETR